MDNMLKRNASWVVTALRYVGRKFFAYSNTQNYCSVYYIL